MHAITPFWHYYLSRTIAANMRFRTTPPGQSPAVYHVQMTNMLNASQLQFLHSSRTQTFAFLCIHAAVILGEAN